MGKIANCTNAQINETMESLRQSNNFNESSKYTWVKKTSKDEIDALFGLMYFRGILGVNLHMTERILSNDSHLRQSNHFRFLKGYICFDNPQEGTQILETDSQLLEISGKSSIQIFQSMLHHRNIF